MPRVPTPSFATPDIAFQVWASSSLEKIICAHFRPATFHALDVAVTVMHTSGLFAAAQTWVPS